MRADLSFGTSLKLSAWICGWALLTPVPASPIWFDETNGGKGYATFLGMVEGYTEFLGEPTGVITFDDLTRGTKLSNQYATSFGVTFLNTANGPNAKYSGVDTEGGYIVENLTGYDGTYMPDGNKVYVKFDNNRTATPFTILFDDPVAGVGAFLGMGVEGKVHNLQISIYDPDGNLLGQRKVESWLWENFPKLQNYETFFSVRTDKPLIGRVEILNLADTDYANGLVVDNLAWSSGDHVAPEPATVLLSMIGALYLWGKPRRNI